MGFYSKLFFIRINKILEFFHFCEIVIFEEFNNIQCYSLLTCLDLSLAGMEVSEELVDDDAMMGL